MATGNPALNESYFESESQTRSGSGVMTLQGTVIKTGVLLTIMVAVAAFAWSQILPYGTAGANQPGGLNQNAMIWTFGGAIGGLILGLILCFKPSLAPVLAPLYAAFEGSFVGGLSTIYAVAAYPGIVMQAAMLTIGVLVMMLALYGTGIIRMSDKLRTGIIAATGAIFLVYLATMVLSFFGIRMPYIHGNGPVGIGFSVVVIIIAAFNLVMDFDMIERGTRYRAPKYMEWYGAYGLLVTLVWLYIEILRLLSKLNSRD